ncbi:MAG: class I SAM-dependent methyltransferase [Desulfobacterales bacterium]
MDVKKPSPPKKIRGFSGTSWPQYMKELQGFIALLKDGNVKSYLEVGCRHGDTFHAVGLALPKGSLLVAVDLPGALWGKKGGGRHPKSDKSLYRAASDLEKRGQKAIVIIGDSHDSEVIKSVRKYAPFDAILIDGDHSFNGVRADWRNYGPMGILVAFHDIHAPKDKGASLFNELKQKYEYTEFAYYNKGGIGVVWRG